MAKLYFRYGAMGSSKTANAIMVRYNYLERGQKVLMLKPKLDSRRDHGGQPLRPFLRLRLHGGHRHLPRRGIRLRHRG